MVNLSGRFKMNDNQLNTSRPEIGKALREHVCDVCIMLAYPK